jgi:hypothetical protein
MLPQLLLFSATAPTAPIKHIKPFRLRRPLPPLRNKRKWLSRRGSAPKIGGSDCGENARKNRLGELAASPTDQTMRVLQAITKDKTSSSETLSDVSG